MYIKWPTLAEVCARRVLLSSLTINILGHIFLEHPVYASVNIQQRMMLYRER